MGDLGIERTSGNGIMTEAMKIEKEIAAILSKKSPEERAYIILKTYCSRPETHGDDKKSRVLFDRWFISPENREAKDKALERVFNEILESYEPDPGLPMNGMGIPFEPRVANLKREITKLNNK